MSAEAKNPCGALGQLTLRDGTVTVGCGLEKGHDVEVRVLREGALLNEYTPADVPGRIAPSLWRCMRVEVEATPHRFWAEWRAEHDPAVVAEEPEWEYGLEMPLHTGTTIVAAGDELTAKSQAWLYPMYRRREAGPWVPVKQEGAQRDD